MKPAVIKSVFNEIPLLTQPINSSHTHPDSASSRASASSFCSRLAQNLGMNSYNIQRSLADERNDRPGSRSHIWTKDLTAKHVDFDPPNNPLNTFIDVDYYMDMNDFLATNEGPTIMYTLNPTVAAKDTGDYVFTFDNQSNIHYRVTGGGEFVHPLWNYNMDHFSVFQINAFTAIFKTFLIERRKVDQNHEIVLIMPSGCWRGLSAFFARAWLQTKSLIRQNFINGEFIRIHVQQPKLLVVSTARVGNYSCATIPVKIDEILSAIVRHSKLDIALSQVQSQLSSIYGQDHDGLHAASATMYDFYRTTTPHKPVFVCPISDSVINYNFNVLDCDPADPPLQEPFMSGFLQNCYIPIRNPKSEEVAIQKRITEIAVPKMPQNSLLTRLMTEYATFLIPEQHTLHPVDAHEVAVRQSRPTQRRIIQVAEFMRLTKVYVASFLKKESYQDVKAPRVISTIPGELKVAYSCFMYSFADNVMYKQPWYAFGKTPKEIAVRVSEICQRATFNAVNSDFSKFDGHGSNLMRELERIVLLRAFHESHHEVLIDLHSKQYNLKAYSTTGIEYKTGYSRASGSPETSTFNSIVNCFVSYVERRTRLNPLTPRLAWESLGIFGGDDGLNYDVYPKVYVNAATSIGQVVTVDEIPRGEMGVKFLARIYSPNVWFGNVNSCCDIPRTLSKLHVSNKLPPNILPAHKLYEKARCLSFSDSETPIVGPYVTKVLAHPAPSAKIREQLASITSWNVRVMQDTHLEATSQYPNEDDGWMTGYASSIEPKLNIDIFNEWITRVDDLSDLLQPPLLCERVVSKQTEPVILNDVLIEPPKTEEKPPIKIPLTKSQKAEKAKQIFEKVKETKQASGTFTTKKPQNSKSKPSKPQPKFVMVQPVTPVVKKKVLKYVPLKTNEVDTSPAVGCPTAVGII